MKRRFLTAVLTFVSVIAVRGLCGTGITAVDFLKISQGNRASAMGSSYVAMAQGPTSLYWNPAGLACGVFNEARMIYNRWIEDIYFGYAAYRHNLNTGGFGFSVTYLNSGDIERRTDGRDISGASYTMSDVAVDVGQGLRLTDNLNCGVSIKFINEIIDEESISGLAAGFGGQFHKKIKEHYIKAGISVMNIGTRMGFNDKYPLPAVVRLGFADSIIQSRLGGSVEIDYFIVEQKLAGGLGIEYSLAPFMDVRAGYIAAGVPASGLGGLTAGIAFRYDEKVEYLFDYTLTSLGDLGLVNRIGTGIRF
jgi:hypothetical protein